MLMIVNNDQKVIDLEKADVLWDTGFVRHHDEFGFFGERRECFYKMHFNEFYLVREYRPSTRTGIGGWLDKMDQVITRTSKPICDKLSSHEVATRLKRYIADPVEYQAILVKLNIC